MQNGRFLVKLHVFYNFLSENSQRKVVRQVYWPIYPRKNDWWDTSPSTRKLADTDPPPSETLIFNRLSLVTVVSQRFRRISILYNSRTACLR